MTPNNSPSKPSSLLTSQNLLTHRRATSPSSSKMHVLLVGATSHLAISLIPTLVASPYIHRLTLLSRSPAPAQLTRSPKVTQLIQSDFDALPASLYASLRDEHAIKAVIWCVGGSISRFPSLDAAQAANVSLPLRFLEGCIAHGLVPTPAGLGASKANKEVFRFLYFSTHDAEQDSFRSLWKEGAFRKMKGAAEKALLGVAEEKGQGMVEVYCLRLGRVLDGGQTVGNVLWEGMGGYVSDELVGKKVVSLLLGGRGKEEGSGVLELGEVLGDGWAEINVVR